jgi:hypothetical protein
MRPVDVIRRHTVCVISPRAGQSAIANRQLAPPEPGSIVMRLAPWVVCESSFRCRAADDHLQQAMSSWRRLDGIVKLADFGLATRVHRSGDPDATAPTRTAGPRRPPFAEARRVSRAA